MVSLSVLAWVRGEESLPALVRMVQPAVVTVVSFDPDKGMPSLGVGFFVAPDRIVSARHAVAGADRVEVRTSLGGTLRITGILAEDRPRDLVLLQVDPAPAPPAVLEIARESPAVGERVFTIGTPLGFEWSVSEGIVSAYREVPDAGTVMQHTVPVSVGSSGGAILNLRGQVVAVQTAIMTEGKKTISAGQGLNFAAVYRQAADLQPGTLRPLAQCTHDLPADWVPPITGGIGKLSLRPLTSDNFHAALGYFEEAVRRVPNEPDAWFRLGLCQEKTGQADQAMENYLKAISLRPAFGVALNNLGAIYNGQRKFEEALGVLRKAVQADEKLVEAHNSMAFACYHLKMYPEAAAAAERALELNPNHMDARYHLAQSCHLMGQTEKARQHCQKLREINPQKADQLEAEMAQTK
ncbi:MAG: tetratricopeptide repeat-containing serine protease family protein [Verrucomicrobia bacterium]|nr:tetratricopeptide repeat-containing serine protease family protein [Verrucomicrobiota bacterium]